MVEIIGKIINKEGKDGYEINEVIEDLIYVDIDFYNRVLDRIINLIILKRFLEKVFVGEEDFVKVE